MELVSHDKKDPRYYVTKTLNPLIDSSGKNVKVFKLAESLASLVPEYDLGKNSDSKAKLGNVLETVISMLDENSKALAVWAPEGMTKSTMAAIRDLLVREDVVRQTLDTWKISIDSIVDVSPEMVNNKPVLLEDRYSIKKPFETLTRMKRIQFIETVGLNKIKSTVTGEC